MRITHFIQKREFSYKMSFFESPFLCRVFISLPRSMSVSFYAVVFCIKIDTSIVISQVYSNISSLCYISNLNLFHGSP